MEELNLIAGVAVSEKTTCHLLKSENTGMRGYSLSVDVIEICFLSPFCSHIDN